MLQWRLFAPSYPEPSFADRMPRWSYPTDRAMRITSLENEIQPPITHRYNISEDAPGLGSVLCSSSV